MENAYYSKWWLPVDISTHGAPIDTLINVIHWFMLVLFVGWLIYFVYVLVRFRFSANPNADLKVRHFKVPTYLEVGIVVIEIVLLVFISQPVWAKYKNEPPKKSEALQVRIVAEQFAWNIHYAGPDGIFGRTSYKLMDSENTVGVDRDDPAGKDDIVTINDFHIPVNKPVIVTLTSKDVIHSFSLPVMRVKQDIIPGMEIPIWFEATQIGSFEIACTQLCGNSHYRMKGAFTVDSADGFQAFLQEEYESLLEDQEDEEEEDEDEEDEDGDEEEDEDEEG